MITDDRIQDFLDADTKQLTNKDIVELIHEYFQAEKTDWYKVKEGKKIWKEKKVCDFWKLIRLHIMPRGRENEYYFEGFIFPEFERNFPEKDEPLQNNWVFWNKGDKLIFDNKVSFDNAKFLSWAFFENVSFTREVSFNKAKFHDFTSFSEAVFTLKAELVSAEFSNKVYFRHTIFKSECNFTGTTFLKKVSYYKANFNGVAVFDSTRFDEQVGFDYLEGKPELLFIGVDFHETNVFRKVNLINVSFVASDVADVQFKLCVWTNRRIKLKMEQKPKLDILEYTDFESTYRQLKRNFDHNKNWELSGRAYVSEMEMRKKRLRLEKSYYHWFIYWFYGFFGGYTQNIKKPIVSLVGLIVVFSIIFFFIDYNPLYAMQRGVKGALPYLTTDMDVREEKLFEGYWLILRNIEIILGGTFLSFFILALRKRFKQ